jgi:hypothetical protein
MLDESFVRSAWSSQELHLVGHHVQAMPRLALKRGPASRRKTTTDGDLLALDEVLSSCFSLSTEAHGLNEQRLLIFTVTSPLGYGQPKRTTTVPVVAVCSSGSVVSRPIKAMLFMDLPPVICLDGSKQLVRRPPATAEHGGSRWSAPLDERPSTPQARRA